MGLLDRIRACRRHDLSHFRPFLVGADQVGWIGHGFAERLRGFPDTFIVEAERVRLAPHLQDVASRTAAMAAVLQRLREDGMLKDWRDEIYPVGTAFHAPPLFEMERAAAVAFGVRSYGVHVNGYVGRGADLQLWVGRRSRSKAVAPGKLDHLVAGGQPRGLTLRENLLKEAQEEASLPAEIAGRARSVSVLSYLLEMEQGLRNDVLFVYDLELPADVTPVNSDGEIEEFFLWPIEQMKRRVAETDDFKFNVGPVIIDFLLRRGFLDPEAPDHLEILMSLRNNPDRVPVA
jgi:hypothetical protein